MNNMKKRDLELYLHIPFCVKKCNYCDFFSAAGSREEQEAYVQAMIQEICGYKDSLHSYEVKTVFLGGGTPSLLSERQAEELFQSLYDSFTIQKDAEITMEVNPGTVNLEKLKQYKAVGVNRLSLGLQSARNEELQRLGRIHTYEDFLATWNFTEKAGFENRNIDLMSALPGQTMESWEDTLEKVIALEPEHISAYSLILEEGTRFYHWYQEGKFDSGEWKLPSEEEEYRMGEWTIERLAKAGMERYEISNYARTGQECRHNLGYWDRVEYLGIGAGASSLLRNRRFSHIRNRKTYIEAIHEKQPIETEEELSKYVLLNIGCGMAKGKYICMMESGYVSFPDRLQSQYEFMEEEHEVVAAGETLDSKSLFLPSVIVRRDVLHRVKYYDESIGNLAENDLLYRLLQEGSVVLFENVFVSKTE